MLSIQSFDWAKIAIIRKNCFNFKGYGCFLGEKSWGKFCIFLKNWNFWIAHDLVINGFFINNLMFWSYFSFCHFSQNSRFIEQIFPKKYHELDIFYNSLLHDILQVDFRISYTSWFSHLNIGRCHHLDQGIWFVHLDLRDDNIDHKRNREKVKVDAA